MKNHSLSAMPTETKKLKHTHTFMDLCDSGLFIVPNQLPKVGFRIIIWNKYALYKTYLIAYAINKNHKLDIQN